MKNVINKIGMDHLWYNKNNQDYFLIIDDYEKNPKLKMVLDGCGSGESSEVGVKLFTQLFNEHFSKEISLEKFEEQVDYIIKMLLNISSNTQFIFNNLFFTIVCVFELEDKFIVKVCGDGYLILQNINNSIEYVSFENGEYPKYILYNYLDSDTRDIYKDGVCFETIEYPKDKFSNVCVASDGLRYIYELPATEKYKFEELILEKKTEKIKMLINRNHSKFKDDITICI